MFSNRLASHLERGVVGFPTTLASSVGLIMASPVILTVTSGSAWAAIPSRWRCCWPLL